MNTSRMKGKTDKFTFKCPQRLVHLNNAFGNDYDERGHLSTFILIFKQFCATINSFELLVVHMFSLQIVCAKDILHDIFMHHEH